MSENEQEIVIKFMVYNENLFARKYYESSPDAFESIRFVNKIQNISKI